VLPALRSSGPDSTSLPVCLTLPACLEQLPYYLPYYLPDLPDLPACLQVAEALDRLDNLAQGDQEVLRFPLSASPQVREDADKSGVPCDVVDVILNESVMAVAEKNRPLKAFLIELVLGHVGDKCKKELDPKVSPLISD
jgi:hypothetical protein